MKKTDSDRDTIFALASGKGRAGVAVIRISGPGTKKVIASMTGKKSFRPRRANLVDLFGPGRGPKIDRAILIFFPAPQSFTGEDVAELHIHGSHAIQEKLFDTLGGMDKCRPAGAGEFTRRAFENGKMDLAQAEGLHDLVFAETEAQRKQALGQMEGTLSRLYESWRDDLISAMARIEATIDFSDEEIPEGLVSGVVRDIAGLKREMEKQLKDPERGEAIRTGFKIVLLGETNVGKSSLLNALANEDRAIVSDVAGTTRDVLEVHMDLGGYPVIFVDTAGLREPGDEIEAEGIRRTEFQAKTAHLKLVLTEMENTGRIPAPVRNQLDDKSLLVLTKADLTKKKKKEKAALAVSVKTGAGLAALLGKIEKKVVEKLSSAEPPGITRIRHRNALEEAVASLNRFLKHDPEGTDPALMAEDLRLAARALGRVTGRVDVEDILDQVFSRFCIGK